MKTRPTYVGYIAMSLDSFIADAEGSVAWLDPFNEVASSNGTDNGYGDFIEQIDALIVGRSTYEQVMGWGWPYDNRPCYVLTRKPGFSGEHVSSAGDIDELRNAIEADGHKRVWVMGGGETQRAALDASMFDSLRVFVMPVVLGGGLPCFAPGPQANLSLIESAQRPGGILQIDYEFKD
ncbi:dihydrofolate reductase family protein [Ruegeria hyattellae]|uniref:dihydrofolate reductase family protein n=1 Tax=Ruegeria hyattellae TaxID=3233337 RepID=UPI00355B692D